MVWYLDFVLKWDWYHHWAFIDKEIVAAIDPNSKTREILLTAL